MDYGPYLCHTRASEDLPVPGNLTAVKWIYQEPNSQPKTMTLRLAYATDFAEELPSHQCGNAPPQFLAESDLNVWTSGCASLLSNPLDGQAMSPGYLMGSLAGTGQKTLLDSEVTHQVLENSTEVHSSHPTMIPQPLQSLSNVLFDLGNNTPQGVLTPEDISWMDLLDGAADHNASQISSKVRESCEDLQRFKTPAYNLQLNNVITAYRAKDATDANNSEISELRSSEFSAGSCVDIPRLQPSIYSSSSSDTSDLVSSERGLTATNAAFLVVNNQHDKPMAAKSKRTRTSAVVNKRHSKYCPHCDVTFPTPSALTRHIEKITRPYACPYRGCIFRCASHRDVERHLATIKHRDPSSEEDQPALLFCPIAGCFKYQSALSQGSSVNHRPLQTS
ncbi:hypothetical protein OIDMADRAFT_30808 [Oidiodendron maius Zn]|uniref:C2H2-type domain-containing protein n=1 Tax=Oidiodendron maius (strain Zn) TaxID=913774 RepID=A0A0C3DB75_OIDMZ|nr:hypothetical protein OIDMADRAFT_30808 [Oidiodendron maius Zn]